MSLTQLYKQYFYHKSTCGFLCKIVYFYIHNRLIINFEEADMDYIRGTRIVLDEEKIKKDGEYDLQEIYQNIDKLAEYAGLIKKNKYTYICKGDEKDLAALGIFNMQNLLKKIWFTKNVKEWIWVDKNEGNTDMIDYYQKNNRGVWA